MTSEKLQAWPVVVIGHWHSGMEKRHMLRSESSLSQEIGKEQIMKNWIQMVKM